MDETMFFTWADWACTIFRRDRPGSKHQGLAGSIFEFGLLNQEFPIWNQEKLRIWEYAKQSKKQMRVEDEKFLMSD